MNLITRRMKYATIITITGRKGFRSLLSALEEGHHRTMVLHRPFASFFLPLISRSPAIFFPFRVNKGKKSGGRIVRGIWSVFDAERARLATEKEHSSAAGETAKRS